MGIPGAVLGYGIHLIAQGVDKTIALVAAADLTVVTAASIVAAAAVMRRYVCSACVNFNRVPKANVDASLGRTP